MEEKLSVERLFYDNLLLLGFEPAALEKKYGATLDANMFKRSNPKAMEVVVYFLLLKISPDHTRDVFKSVWPPVDRDQQRDFKKYAFEALEKLEKDAKIPPNSVRLSHLQTCFGERFYLLMWNLSLHAMRVVLRREYPEASVPTVSLDATTMKRAAQISRVLKAQIVIQRDLLLGTATRSTAAQKQWHAFAERIQSERKDLSYQLTEVKDLQSRVDDELKKLPPADDAHQAAMLKDVRAEWTTLSQQANSATKAAPMIDGILARTCNAVRLESPSGDRIEPAALAEHWRVSVAALQRSMGNGLVVTPATKTVLEEQVRNHETQLAALRSLNASLSASLAAMQAAMPSLLSPAPAQATPLFVPPTPARLQPTTSNARIVATRRMPALVDAPAGEENLQQSIRAAAERSIAPAAPVLAPVVLPAQSEQQPAQKNQQVAVAQQQQQHHHQKGVASRTVLAPVNTSVARKPQAGRKGTREVIEPQQQTQEEANDSLTEIAEAYVQQARPSAPVVITKAVETTNVAARSAAKAKAKAKNAAPPPAALSPAPPRSARLASMRARTQALLTASPPPPPAAIFVSPIIAQPVQQQQQQQQQDEEDEPILSDLSLSVLSTALPSPIASSSGAPPVFELAASPPLFSLESISSHAPAMFTLDDEHLALSPLVQ